MNDVKSKHTRTIFRFFLKTSRGFLKSGSLSPIVYPIADYFVDKIMGGKDVFEIQGFKMKKGKTTRLPILTGEIEPAATNLIKKEIEQGMNVLDLGANIGWFTLWFSKLVGDSGHVYSFEPDPDLFAVLKENVELNKLKNVSTFQIAVSNRSGKGRLSLNPTQQAANRLDSHMMNKKTIEVDTISIDDFCKQNQVNIDFVKMDVEGSEPKVFEGMKNLILSNPKIKIIAEFCPSAIIDVGSSPKEFFNILEKFRFTIKEIDEATMDNLKPIDKDQFLQKKNIRPNLFCYISN